ncbi:MULTISPECIES: hypothetical protein [unclassified Pseudofrankia]|uniref:hypothetical protein n=1 Tax=unclassified Pseudofrankia TaxID=2994372 RepID=UPI0008DB281F|nr:hypothetical protein [Pseudofrankia sp. BMG5.37]MDT3446334.1 hypothetical protein [Pseudofrankia sp. BMG5.37]OHV56741.1 hypothetical protein BCD48_43610 [Pseudofrankia sp. BMG5.36]
MPAAVRVTQHDLCRARCVCGKVHVAGQPEQVSQAAVSYGPVLRGWGLYLLVRQHLPVERAAELLRELTGRVLSTG